jgi:hypothetical protein
MTSKEKYYTPTIEEFHVGFEYEYNNNHVWMHEPTKGEWKKEEYINGVGQDGESDYHEIMNMLEHNEVRVKHLDREDIESLGWEDCDTPTGYAGGHYWIKDAELKHGNRNIVEEMHLIHQPLTNWILIWQVMRLTTGDTNNTRFSGVIKNKSELKRLLKQIGI